MSAQEPRTFTDTVFEREDVLLDGVRFQRCQFGPNARLIFRGTALPLFDECLATDRVELVLGGHAMMTVQFLALFYHAGGEAGAQAVERLFDDLRRGAFP